MTDTTDKKDLSLLSELMLRGKNFRQEHDAEVFGGEVTLVFKPVEDEEYIPFLGVLQDKLGLSEDDAKEQIEEALEDADGEAAEVDLSSFDKEFVVMMKTLCRLGIDAEAMGGDDELLASIIDGAVGGYTLEWGFEIMDLTGNLRDAKRFRSGRNRA